MPFCALERTRQRTSCSTYWKAVKGYPEAPKTIGEHLRRRRLDLGLKQTETAGLLGVHIETLKNWEHGVPPTIGAIPKVIEFLGSNPLPEPTSFAERLVYYRTCRGLRQAEFAERLGVNPSTLARWEAGFLPSPARIRKIEAVLAKGT